MNINESNLIYLENYYILEQTRNEINHFLEDIAIRFSTLVDEDIKPYNTDEIIFNKYVQNGGGHVHFSFEKSKGIAYLENIEKWKYYIVYDDAMRKEDLSSSTKCRVCGYSPLSYRNQINELKRMAGNMRLHDPYESTEIDLLRGSSDETVGELRNIFMEYHSNFLKIVEALIEEVKEKNQRGI
jgi:hypothetical protein